MPATLQGPSSETPGASFTTQIRERWERKRCKLLARPTKHNYSLTGSCLDAAASDNYKCMKEKKRENFAPPSDWRLLTVTEPTVTWHICSQLRPISVQLRHYMKRSTEVRVLYIAPLKSAPIMWNVQAGLGLAGVHTGAMAKTRDDRSGCEISVRPEPRRRFFSNAHKMSFCGGREQKVDFWWNRKFACIAATLKQQLQREIIGISIERSDLTS